MTLWMIWAIVVTVLVGAAARSVEQGLVSTGRPTRWAWVSALVATVGLQLWSLLGRDRVDAGAETPGRGLGTLDGRWLAHLRATGPEASTLLDRMDVVLGPAWGVTAATAFLLLAAGLLTLRRRADRWETAHVDGEDVLVSPDFGPALIGVRRPRIVLPRWALGLPDTQLRLTCLHEREHRAAGDGHILLAGAVVLALAPWNPALWWIVRRLRAAVEIDCDTRVLRRGARPGVYGRMLLDLGANPCASRLPALSLTRPPSLLERRLRMIVDTARPHRRGRALVAAAFAAVLVAMACATEPPTTPGEQDPPDGTVVTPDGRVGQAEPNPVVRLRSTVLGSPLIYVDGVRIADEGAREEVLAELDPDEIDRIEVIKGEAAARLFGPEGSDGVIQIFTRAGSAGG